MAKNLTELPPYEEDFNRVWQFVLPVVEAQRQAEAAEAAKAAKAAKADLDKILSKVRSSACEGNSEDIGSQQPPIKSIVLSPALTAPMLLSMLTILSLIPHAGRGNSDLPAINPQGMAHPCDRLNSEGASPSTSLFQVFDASNTDADSIACVRNFAHGDKSPLCVTDVESACENFFQGRPFEHLITTVSREELIQSQVCKSLEGFLSTRLRYDLSGNTASVRDARMIIDEQIKITKQLLDTVSPKNLWEPQDDRTKELTLFLEKLEDIKSRLLKKKKGVLGFIDNEIKLLAKERAEIEQKMNPVGFFENFNMYHDQKEPIFVIAGDSCKAFRFFNQTPSKGRAKDPYGRNGATHYGNHHCGKGR